MSWSVIAVGHAPAVGKKLASDFNALPRMHPAEESVKTAAAALVAQITASHTSPNPLKITASGSIALASVPGRAAQDSQVSHSFSLTVETLWGFAE